MTALVWAVTLALFFSGLATTVLRRQLLAMLLGLELMISSVNVALVYSASLAHDPDILAVVLLLLAVAAAEAVVGLGLIMRAYSRGIPAETEAFAELRG